LAKLICYIISYEIVVYCLFVSATLQVYRRICRTVHTLAMSTTNGSLLICLGHE